MARISIKDLPQNDALDREAMASILGGARAGVRPAMPAGTQRQADRIVDYPPGFGHDKAALPDRQRQRR